MKSKSTLNLSEGIQTMIEWRKRHSILCLRRVWAEAEPMCWSLICFAVCIEGGCCGVSFQINVSLSWEVLMIKTYLVFRKENSLEELLCQLWWEVNNCTSVILRALWKISKILLWDKKHPEVSPEAYSKFQSKMCRYFHNAKSNWWKIINVIHNIILLFYSFK